MAVPAHLRERLAGAEIPRHLAVIPDGNRRWATAHNLSPEAGHRKGFEIAKRLSKFTREIGIHTVTVWAFSTENWKRSIEEITALMALYEEWLRDLIGEAVEEEVRVVHLGRLRGLPPGAESDATAAGLPEGLPASLVDALEEIERKTASYERSLINLAINYGGADELQRALELMHLEAQESNRDPLSLRLEDYLDTAGQPHPNPDVVWRTSGEYRTSGFLPLQSAYSELVFSEDYFPDLTEEDVVDVVLEYSARARRFGG